MTRAQAPQIHSMLQLSISPSSTAVRKAVIYQYSGLNLIKRDILMEKPYTTSEPIWEGS